jgi:hypothetical protein
VQDSVDQLASASGVNLFVVYVDSFSGATDR